ncbi:GNAT family N-acetyltransferase [Henriciella litoralis]|uniref:GNAT family N-acetyltransferase n=1 Tax=Henriciella litoralis TaxID=568102 RepID=UPI001F422FE5|nr:GNAT family N-acetyltransferase [Henriciella litoralis]
MLLTKRLHLRGAAASDFEASAAMWQDPEVVRFIGGQTRDHQDAWFTMCRMRGMWDLIGYGNWIVCERGSGQFLGEIGLADFMRGLQPDLSGIPEAGWAFARHAHGQGYATEALKAVLSWADSELKAPKIACIIDHDNAASRAVAEKCGFVWVTDTSYRGSDVQLFERHLPA